MKRTFLCLLSLSMLTITSYAWAQSVSSFRIKSKSAANKSVSAAIERTLEPISRMYRGMARPKFQKMAAPCVDVRIEQTDAKIVIACTRANGKTTKHAAPSDGSPKKIKNDKGETVMLRHKLKDDEAATVLVQEFKNKSTGGSLTTRYKYEGEGMRAKVKIAGPKLKVPLTYAVDYVRR